MEEISLELPAAVTVSGEGDADFENLTQKDKEMILAFIDRLDMSDSSLPLTYGVSCQNKIARFSDQMLNAVRNEDTAEAGKLLNRLVDQIESYDEDTHIKGGFFKLFDTAGRSLDKLKEEYGRIASGLERICDELVQFRRKLLRNVTMYDTLYENNREYIRELTLYIIAGEKRLVQIKEAELPELSRKAELTGKEEDRQRIKDLISASDLFERRIQDLKISRVVALQMVPQIRMMQKHDSRLADKIQSSLVNALPLWKNQITLALGIASGRSAMEAQRRVSDTSDEMLKKNGELLKKSAAEAVKDSEKTHSSLESVRKTNKELLETIREVMDIQHRGREERIAAEMEFVKLETELKKAFVDAGHSSLP